MSRSFILCGPSFSGKTHIAEQISKSTNAITISFDDLRRELFPYKLSLESEDWMVVKTEALKRYQHALEQKISVIWDSTNPLRSYRQELIELARRFGATEYLIHLNTPKEIVYTRRRRNAEYPTRHQIEDKDFDSTLQEWEQPSPEEGNLIVLSSPEEVSSFIRALENETLR